MIKFKKVNKLSRVVGLVTARAGSKGYPNKNIAVLNVGINSKVIDEIYISSDSSQYIDIAVNAGAKSLGLRPESLATDSARTIDVIEHFILSANLKANDVIVLLQPTSPIRTTRQVELAVEKHRSSNESVVTVAKLDEPNPHKLKVLDGNGYLRPLLKGTSSEIPRQELPDSFQLTGAIYVSSVENINMRSSFFSENTIPLVTDIFANIDNQLDFEFLKFRCENGLTW